MGIDNRIDSSLTLVGYWDVSGHNKQLEGWWIHPKHLIRNGFYGEVKGRVVEYLRSGSLVHSYMGYSYCRLDPTIPGEDMGYGELTDGYWIWPQGLAVYVERFDVMLPAEFLAYMSDHDYIPGEFSVSPDDVISEWGFWMGWCSAMKQSMNCEGITAPWRVPPRDENGEEEEVVYY